VAVLAAALLGSWATVRRGSPPAPPPRLPAASEVEGITTRCLPFQGVLPGTDEFAVPAEYIPALLRALGEPQPAEDLTRYCDELAVLRLACRGGQKVVVRLYFFGTEPARYSIDGVHCRRSGAYIGDPRFPLAGGSPGYMDESNFIAEVLRQMARQPLDEWTRSSIAGSLGRLDRSAGRTPESAGHIGVD
jgi:hypothetical protein